MVRCTTLHAIKGSETYSLGMARARLGQPKRCVALFIVVGLGAAACSATAPPEVAPEIAAQTEAPGASAAPTSPPPTAVPTPTALPTPTPTPEPVIATDLLLSSIDENFAALDELGVDYSFALFVEGAGYLGQRNAQTRLIPASNQKLVTAVGSLELLRQDFRFQTEVRVDADSNVYIVGGGDPTLTSEHIADFADELIEQLGVETNGDSSEPAEGEAIADDAESFELRATIGDIVVDPSHFPPTRTGPGWLDRYIPNDVGPMSGFMIDDNQHRGDDEYLADPDLGNAQLVAEIFEDAGIEVTGEIRVGAADLDAPVLVRRASPALEALIATILGRSDNEIANALVRQIGLELGGEGEIPVGQALIFERLGELGVQLGPPVGDGAGLSRDNRLSATDIVEVLRLARNEPWWPVLLDSLASAGTDGTLGARLATDTTTGNVRAKTGTLEDARALSGVLTMVDGAEAFFSLIVNGEEAEEALMNLDQVIIAYASATLAQLEGG